MRRPGIDGRHEHQALQAGVVLLPTSFRASFGTSFRRNRCHHDGNGAAVGSTQQIEISKAERVRELKDALGSGTYGAVHVVTCCRQASSQIVDGINGRVGSQRGDGESPGKGISHQPMNQDDRRAGSGLEVAHASAGEFEPVFFDRNSVFPVTPVRIALAGGGADEFFFGMLGFCGQRSPRRQSLTKWYRIYRFGELKCGSPSFLLLVPHQFASAATPAGTTFRAFFRFLPSSFFSTLMPLSTCFSSRRNGGRKRRTVSWVALKSTPSARPCSTNGRAGMSRTRP